MKTKTCKNCGIEKPLTDYTPVARGKFGVKAVCKDCKHENYCPQVIPVMEKGVSRMTREVFENLCKNHLTVTFTLPGVGETTIETEELFEYVNAIRLEQPELVYCKDCKYVVPTIYGWCACEYSTQSNVLDKGFCSFGEVRSE